MPQLPCACHHQNNNLYDTIPHRLGVGSLAEISEISLSFSLVLLLPSDILEFLVQIANFGCQFRDMRAVVLGICFCGADNDVQIQADVRVGEPGRVICGKADRMVACFVRGECECTFAGSFCVYYVVAALHFLKLSGKRVKL